MRAHIFHDDKFTDDIVFNIRRWGDGNDAFFVWQKKGEQRSYVRSGDISWISKRDLSQNDFIRSFNKFGTITFHFLKGESLELLARLPGSIRFIWVFWGSDGYNLPKLRENIYEPSTTKLLKTLQSSEPKAALISRLKKSLKMATRQHPMVRALKKVDYVASWVDGDYALLKKHYSFKAKLVPFANFSIEHLFNFEIPPLSPETNNATRKILLGNSGDPSNNHLEVFEMFKNDDVEILCPLSYGTQEGYILAIQQEGKKMFGDRFKPLIDFIDKKSYNSLLQSIDIFAFNHVRQQAVGNTFAALVLGKVLVLHEESPVYHTYKNWGIKVFTARDVKNKTLQISDDVRMMNRRVIMEKLGEDEVHRQYVSILSII